MKKLMGLLLVILGTTTMSLVQQKNGKVTGQVIDGSSKVIEAATISLLRAKDSSVAKISVADKQGKFVFELVGDGKYMVSITAVGHAKAFSETFEITESKPLVELKTIATYLLDFNVIQDAQVELESNPTDDTTMLSSDHFSILLNCDEELKARIKGECNPPSFSPRLI